MPGIVVGIDGSSHSLRALEWAMKEAAAHHAPLTVLAVHPGMAGWYGTSVDYPGDAAFNERARAAAQEETDKVLAMLGDARPESVTVKAVSGIPAEELVRASADADLVVVGSRGGGGFAQLAMGSVSSQVAHHAHCPIVIIPHDKRG